MAAFTRDISPYRLKLKRWEHPCTYVFTIEQAEVVNRKRMSTRCAISITITMMHYHENTAVFQLEMDKPVFNENREYDKIQWVFTHLFSLNEKILLQIGSTGAVRQIINKQQIRKKWPPVRRRILEVYDDPLIEDLLDRHEQNMEQHFQSLYRRETMMQFLFNDLFRKYPGNKRITSKKTVAKHFGEVHFPVIERKKLSGLDTHRGKAVIATEGSPDADRIDSIKAVNNYLGRVAGDLPGQPYRFSYQGEYEINTRLSCISKACLRVEGTMGEVYQKQTTYNLTLRDHE